jgi:hypothetical protein
MFRETDCEYRQRVEYLEKIKEAKHVCPYVVYVGNCAHSEYKTLSAACRKANQLTNETTLVVRVIDRNKH